MSPRNASTDPDSGLRFYEWMGRQLLSVTSLRRVLGMPFGLATWQVNQAIDAALSLHAGGELPSLPPEVLENPKHPHLLAARKAIRAMSVMSRDKAADLGTRVHHAADMRADPRKVDAEVAPFLYQFYDAEDVLDMQTVKSEGQVFNLTLGYAGSFDRIAHVTIPSTGEKWLAMIDLKTGAGLYVEHLLQCLAYIHGEFVGQDDVVDMAATNALKQCQGAAILHLSPSGWELVDLKTEPAAINAFHDMVRLANWMMVNPDLTNLINAKVTGSTLVPALAASIAAVEATTEEGV